MQDCASFDTKVLDHFFVGPEVSCMLLCVYVHLLTTKNQALLNRRNSLFLFDAFFYTKNLYKSALLVFVCSYLICRIDIELNL